MHGFGGGYNRSSLLRACIFREAGVFLAPEGRHHMRFMHGLSRMRCSAQLLRSGAPLVRDRSGREVWNGPGSRPGQVKSYTAAGAVTGAGSQ
jgi:hypothetical protein